MKEIQKSILATIVYFDLFDYPLLADEVLVYLMDIVFLNKDFRGKQGGIMNYELRIKDKNYLKKELDELVENKKIGQKDGFYFLPGREEIVAIRKQRYQISLKKIKKAKRVVFWLRFIPWIKAIFISSSLGFLNTQEKSDIDLFIIANRGGLWSARFWSVVFLKIFGLRPQSNEHHGDKFCLSYFVSEDDLDLEQTQINAQDVHLIYLLSYYLPLYTEDNLWQRFVKANNWISRYLPNFSYKRDPFDKLRASSSLPLGSLRSLGVAQDDVVIKPRLLWLKKIIRNSQFNWEEKLLKKFQLKIMPKVLKEMANQDKRVIINDKVLKLHSNDKRLKYYNDWILKYNKIIESV